MNANILLLKSLPQLVLILLLAGCAASRPDIDNAHSVSRVRLENQQWLKQALFTQFKEWRSVPHRTGGLSKSGIDCSGFVYLTFLSKFGIKLPRSSAEQMRIGQAISSENLITGDLVFFKIDGDTRHVGIYLDHNQFMHVSSSKGVTISNLNAPYWSGKYWLATRVI
ncbi:MAG: NlpC/P60 family protein [Gammaproteobacteria bacterium]